MVSQYLNCTHVAIWLYREHCYSAGCSKDLWWKKKQREKDGIIPLYFCVLFWIVKKQRERELYTFLCVLRTTIFIVLFWLLLSYFLCIVFLGYCWILFLCSPIHSSTSTLFHSFIVVFFSLILCKYVFAFFTSWYLT